MESIYPYGIGPATLAGIHYAFLQALGFIVVIVAFNVAALIRWHRDQLHRALIRDIEHAGIVFAAACEARRARELEQAVCALERQWDCARA